jgi:hypothetical protein
MNDKILNALKDMVEIQGRDGNWNCDEYMHGMYNGMEFMLSIVESREPIYRSKPEKWLSDQPRNYVLAEAQ